MGLLKKREPWEQSFRAVWRREERFHARYAEQTQTALDRKIEAAVPEKLRETLHAAFAKAFEAVFEKGTAVICKAGRIEEKRRVCQINALAAELKEDRKSLRAFSRASDRAGAGNTALAAAAGIGMGAFGVALPDIPLFTALLLKSIYETAESYGFCCDAEEERSYALRLIQAALSSGDTLRARSRALDAYAQTGSWPEQLDRREEIAGAAAALSQTLLYGKFLQGIPVVGLAGGAEDAVCLRRVQQYAAIRYQKRFLIRRHLRK